MQIRKTSHNDGQFILALIVKHSKDHFNPIWVEPEYQKLLVEQIKSTVNTGSCPMPDGVYPSSIHTLVVKGCTVGFLWLLNRANNETEIYIMSIAPEHRRKGYAEYLVETTLSTLKPGTTVTSRTKRKSKKMKALLRKLAFKTKFSFLNKTQHFFRVIS